MKIMFVASLLLCAASCSESTIEPDAHVPIKHLDFWQFIAYLNSAAQSNNFEAIANTVAIPLVIEGQADGDWLVCSAEKLEETISIILRNDVGYFLESMSLREFFTHNYAPNLNTRYTIMWPNMENETETMFGNLKLARENRQTTWRIVGAMGNIEILTRHQLVQKTCGSK